LRNERSEFFLAVSDHFELAIAELVSLEKITLNVVASTEIDKNFLRVSQSTLRKKEKFILSIFNHLKEDHLEAKLVIFVKSLA